MPSKMQPRRQEQERDHAFDFTSVAVATTKPPTVHLQLRSETLTLVCARTFSISAFGKSCRSLPSCRVARGRLSGKIERRQIECHQCARRHQAGEDEFHPWANAGDQFFRAADRWKAASRADFYRSTRLRLCEDRARSFGPVD